MDPNLLMKGVGAVRGCASLVCVAIQLLVMGLVGMQNNRWYLLLERFRDCTKLVFTVTRAHPSPLSRNQDAVQLSLFRILIHT